MVKESDWGLRICPADSHPSGGFPVSDFGLRIEDVGCEILVYFRHFSTL